MPEKVLCSRQKHWDEISCLKDSLGNILNGKAKESTAIVPVFRSSFMMESADHNLELGMGEDTAVIETVAFSVDKVRRVLNQIKPDKSPGPDGSLWADTYRPTDRASNASFISVRAVNENRKLAFAVEISKHLSLM
ncbi:unnamed protein product [Schistocephalus solidus]|uniref:START domain-containing protein n=1 Tax=Schistocephalus solidus TaxID=70667 RepID=A0A183S819_SCHSO|nr:unnamed protein product [Schistocephalus solidus]